MHLAQTFDGRRVGLSLESDAKDHMSYVETFQPGSGSGNASCDLPATDTPKLGYAWLKFVVPSKGSTAHKYLDEGFPEVPPSSPRKQ